MRRLSYAQAFWCASFVLLVGVIYVASSAWCVSAESIAKYHRVVAKSPRKQRERNLAKGTAAVHPRKGVVKTMWLQDGPLERMVNIHCDSSELGVVREQARVHLTETFHQVRGVIQEELFYEEVAGQATAVPRQRFRYFEAAHAVYDFQDQQLVAHDVTFWNYSADGHELVSQIAGLVPDAKGAARSLTMHLAAARSVPDFQAEHLEMQLSSGGEIW
jgi:hypothetical protein